ncbi:MAG: NAD(P)-dependent oxidoreductase [Chloroflexi bacterium]|nr:NAD(P)-dependent oxidoreductase [Chloroflexota bacterium]
MSSLILGPGYIGSALAQRLLAAGRPIVALDNLFSTDPAVIERFSRSPDFRFVEGSIADPAALDAAFEAAQPVETIYLLAAQSSGHAEAASPEYTEETNLRGPRLVVEALTRALAHSSPVLVYASSLKILGEPLPPVVAEDGAYGVQTDLAHLSKVYVEKLLEMEAWRRGMAAVALRIGLVYGVGPVVKRDPRFMTAPNKFCQQAIRGETIRVTGGGPVGLIHVADAAAALEAARRLAPASGYRAVNAPAEVVTIAAVARLVVAIAARHGISPSVELPGDPADAPPVAIASSLGKAGFQLRRSLDEGIAEFFAYLVSQGDDCPPGAS